jgi:hypothetical protein
MIIGFLVRQKIFNLQPSKRRMNGSHQEDGRAMNVGRGVASSGLNFKPAAR